MPRYANGQIPMNVLVSRGAGTNADGYWEFRMPAATAYRWDNLVADVRASEGKTPAITPGWNAYRPIDAQWTAYRNSPPGMAAWPGTSSHGGNFEGRDSIAIDVGNWGILGEAKFFHYARKHGFVAGYFNGQAGRPREPWHIIDFDPWAAVPAGKEEDSMSAQDVSELKTYIAQQFHNNLSYKGAAYTYPAVADDKLNDLATQVARIRDGQVKYPNAEFNAFEALMSPIYGIQESLDSIKARLDALEGN